MNDCVAIHSKNNHDADAKAMQQIILRTSSATETESVSVASTAQEVESIAETEETTVTVVDVEYNVLLQKLPQEEFINRCRKETTNLICNIYAINDCDSLEIEDMHNHSDGSLYFPLATDVFTVIDCQIALIRDYRSAITAHNQNHNNNDGHSDSHSDGHNETLSSPMDFFGSISSFLFENLRSKQIEFRNQFLKDLEYCCAASNTFLKMADRCEEMFTMLFEEFDNDNDSSENDDNDDDVSVRTLTITDCKQKEYESQFCIAQNHCSELSLLYRADAIYSAQYTHIYIFKSIREIYIDQLFSKEWESNFQENEISLSIVRTLTEYWTDVEKYLGEQHELAEKAAIALIESCVVFYTQVIFKRARHENENRGWEEKEAEDYRLGYYEQKNDQEQRVRWPHFKDPTEALQRLYVDMKLLKNFFQTLPVAMDIVEHRLAILVVIYKCIKSWMELENEAAATDIKTLTHLFSVLDSFTGNPEITSACMEELFYLFKPIDPQSLVTLKLRKAEKILLHPRSSRRQVPGLKVSAMLADMYKHILDRPFQLEKQTQLTRLKSMVKTTSKRFETNLSKSNKFKAIQMKSSKKIKSSKTVKRCLNRSKSMTAFISSKSNSLRKSGKVTTPEDESTFIPTEGIDLCFLPDQEVYQESPVSDMFNQFLGALPSEEFLSRFHAQSTDLIERVYTTDRAIDISNNGQLTTQLCSDIFSITHSQLNVVYQYLKSTDSIVSVYRKEVIDKAAWFLIESLRFHQIHSRDSLLIDFDYCCAASNDFSTMATSCEEFVSMLQSRNESSDATNDHASELILLYFEDAVHAAQCTHLHVFEPMRETVMERLFLSDWEESFTHNELARSIVTTIDDFVNDLEQYLSDEYLVAKALHAILEATVLFYFESLVSRARKRRLFRSGCFTDCGRAVRRFQDDTEVFKTYFYSLDDKYAGFERFTDKVFEKLKIFYDLLVVYGFANIGSDCSEREIESFIPKLVDLFGDVYLTKCCMSDLFNLFDPMQHSYIWKIFSNMERNLSSSKKRMLDDFSYNRRRVPRLNFYSILHYVYQTDLAERALSKYQKYKKHAIDVGLLTYTNNMLKYRVTRVLLSSFEITAKGMIQMAEKTAPLQLILHPSSGFNDVSAFMATFNSNGTMCATPILKYLLGKVKYTDDKILD